MSFDFTTLEPRILDILSAPGTDLSTISAKRVRRQLLDQDPTLTAELFKEHRDEVDAVIASVFEQVSGGQGDEADDEPAEDTKSRKRKQEEDSEVPGADEDEEEDFKPAPKKSKKAKNGREMSDAELARKLSSEINGRATRTGAKGKAGAGSAKKGARTKKSAATVDSDDDSDSEKAPKKRNRKASDGGANGEKAPKKKRKAPEGGAKGGFGKEFVLSEPLSAVLNVDKLSRPQVVKQLWAYIKGNDLQNPANRREILCDGGLRAVFGVDKVNMFKMNKILGEHLHEIE